MVSRDAEQEVVAETALLVSMSGTATAASGSSRPAVARAIGAEVVARLEHFEPALDDELGEATAIGHGLPAGARLTGVVDGRPAARCGRW